MLFLPSARGRSSMVERQLPKLHTRVRFPSPAPILWPIPKNGCHAAKGRSQITCCRPRVEHPVGAQQQLTDQSDLQKEFDLRAKKLNAEAIAKFPFPRVEVRGEDALSTWEKLRTAGRGIPIIVGNDESLVNLMYPFDPSWSSKSVGEILKAASRIKIPGDLYNMREKESEEVHAMTRKSVSGPDGGLPKVFVTKDSSGRVRYDEVWGKGLPAELLFGGDAYTRKMTPQETRAFLSRESPLPKTGDWPSGPAALSSGLLVATDGLTGKPLRKVSIALIPTKDWTEVPAYLRWGEWNDCPASEYHVATLRSWRDRYGVELIGLSFNSMDLRAARRPSMREKALALAREQYAYCPDLIEPPDQTYSGLAAELMADEWWSFWWHG